MGTKEEKCFTHEFGLLETLGKLEFWADNNALSEDNTRAYYQSRILVIIITVPGKLKEAHGQSCVCKYKRNHSWSSLETVAPNQDGNGHARHAA